MPADAQNLVNLCATRGYAKLSHRSLLECIAQGAGGVATPKPPAASFSFAPASGVVVWGDKNGQHTGNLAVFNATADKATTYGLDLGGNALTSVTGLSSMPLTHLGISNNLLTTLDVTGCTLLSDLDCGNNHITSITGLSTCTALTQLSCNNNSITSITGLSTCTSLTYLNCNSNSITNISVAALTLLAACYFKSNNLSASVVSSVLCQLDANGLMNGDMDISQNSVPTAGGLVCSVNLDPGKEWSVVHD